MATLSNEELVKLEKVASQVRRDIVRMVHGAKGGHPGGALGCTDYLVALYFHLMEHNAEFNMDATNEDLFFLSNGHISAVLYSTLAHAGYFDKKELATHRKINSRLQGHPATEEGLEGIRMAAGSLGQGLSSAIGSAQTKKLNKENNLVYCLMGDGEIQEGQVWEAAMYAAHNKVDNLIATIDYNNCQIDGTCDEVLSNLDLRAKWEAFGWEVIELKDGNNMADVIETFELAKTKTGNGKPIMVIMTTIMGSGVDYMMGTHKWHGVAPNDDELASALGQLEETLGDF